MAFNDSKTMENRVEKVAASGSINSNEDVDGKKGDDLDQARQFAASWVNGTAEEKKLVRAIEVIGEAASKLSADTRSATPSVRSSLHRRRRSRST